MRPDELPEIDLIAEQSDDAGGNPGNSLLAAVGVIMAIAGLVAGVLMVATLGGSTPRADQEGAAAPDPAPDLEEADPETSEREARRQAAQVARRVPAPLLAAEMFQAAPSADGVRAVLDAIGGPTTLVVGKAEGLFDLVTFDPSDPDRLLASRRSTQGPADNRAVNEAWIVEDGLVEQQIFAPDRRHDFVHYNADGTISVWSDSEGTEGEASRVTTLQGKATTAETAELTSGRAVAAEGTVFALTVDPDNPGPSGTFEALIADRDGTQIVLDNGDRWGRVDSPAPGLVVAYPRADGGRTRVWDAASTEEIVDHPLAGRLYVAADVSGDGTSAVGMTLDGEFEVLALPEGVVTDRFGYAAPRAASVPQPITLDETGRIAVSVGRLGTVSMWWVGDDEPLLSLAGDGGLARTAPAERALRSATAILPESWALSSASAVEQEARRVALRLRASPGQPTVWRIFDIDLDGWIAQACALAERPLSEEERRTLGLAEAVAACSGP